MAVKIDDKKWESAMDLANSENYQTTLDHLESWTDTLATFGPESLPRVYGEMVEFLKSLQRIWLKTRQQTRLRFLNLWIFFLLSVEMRGFAHHCTSEGLKLSY